MRHPGRLVAGYCRGSSREGDSIALVLAGDPRLGGQDRQEDRAARQSDCGTVSTDRPIWSLGTLKASAEPCSCEGGAARRDAGGRLAGGEAALLEKPRVLVVALLTVGQQQHGPAEKKGSDILGCIPKFRNLAGGWKGLSLSTWCSLDCLEYCAQLGDPR